MRYGYWMPVFGGWLRNVDDENMAPTWEYNKRLAQRTEQIGFDLSLVAELNLNDIKGEEAPSLDAWSTAAALMAVTQKLELMVAVRPTFHNPALLAKQAANIDHIGGGGRLSLNVVSSWWKDEATKYGVHFEQHDDRYARTAEWLAVVDGVWKQRPLQLRGQVLPRARQRASAEAREQAAAGDLRRRRIRSGEEPHRQDVRRLRDARRPAGAHRGEGRGHAPPPRRIRPAADDLRRRRVQHRAEHGSRGEGGTGPHHGREADRRPGTTTTSSGSPARSSNSACRWKITRCPTAACAAG